MLLLSVIAFSLGLESYARMVPIRRADAGVNQITILYDGRAPSDFTTADLDASNGPFSTYVIRYIVLSYASTRGPAVQ